MTQFPRDEELRTLAKTDGMIAIEQINMLTLGDVVTASYSHVNSVLSGIKLALLGLVEENDDLLEGYLKVAGEAADMEDELDGLREKKKKAELACARLGHKLGAQRATLLEAVAAAAGRKEL
jgi:hypothetical protein